MFIELRPPLLSQPIYGGRTMSLLKELRYQTRSLCYKHLVPTGLKNSCYVRLIAPLVDVDSLH